MMVSRLGYRICLTVVRHVGVNLILTRNEFFLLTLLVHLKRLSHGLFWDDLNNALRLAPLVQGLRTTRLHVLSALGPAAPCAFSVPCRLLYHGSRILFDGFLAPHIGMGPRIAPRPEMLVPFPDVGVGKTRFLLQHLIDQFVQVVNVPREGFTVLHFAHFQREALQVVTQVHPAIFARQNVAQV
jgi:hypothetical protein